MLQIYLHNPIYGGSEDPMLNNVCFLNTVLQIMRALPWMDILLQIPNTQFNNLSVFLTDMYDTINAKNMVNFSKNGDISFDTVSAKNKVNVVLQLKNGIVNMNTNNQSFNQYDLHNSLFKVLPAHFMLGEHHDAVDAFHCVTEVLALVCSLLAVYDIPPAVLLTQMVANEPRLVSSLVFTPEQLKLVSLASLTNINAVIAHCILCTNNEFEVLRVILSLLLDKTGKRSPLDSKLHLLSQILELVCCKTVDVHSKNYALTGKAEVIVKVALTPVVWFDLKGSQETISISNLWDDLCRRVEDVIVRCDAPKCVALLCLTCAKKQASCSSLGKCETHISKLVSADANSANSKTSSESTCNFLTATGERCNRTTEVRCKCFNCEHITTQKSTYVVEPNIIVIGLKAFQFNTVASKITPLRWELEVPGFTLLAVSLHHGHTTRLGHYSTLRFLFGHGVFWIDDNKVCIYLGKDWKDALQKLTSFNITQNCTVPYMLCYASEKLEHRRRTEDITKVFAHF